MQTFMVLSVWRKTQSTSAYDQVRAGRWTLGPFSKFSLPVLVSPTQTCIYTAIKKNPFLEYFSKGKWHWTKHCWFSPPSTANLIFLTENVPDRLAFQSAAGYVALHYLFKEEKANKKKLNMETEISRKEQKLASKFIGPTYMQKKTKPFPKTLEGTFNILWN